MLDHVIHCHWDVNFVLFFEFVAFCFQTWSCANQNTVLITASKNFVKGILCEILLIEKGLCFEKR